MSNKSPPDRGGETYDEAMNWNETSSSQNVNVSDNANTSSTSAISNQPMQQRQVEEISRSVQTASGDSITQKLKEFNLQKPHIYSNNIYVFLEKNNNENIGRLHPMVVGHILHKKLNIPNIMKIEKVGRNRIRVELKSIKDANNLVNNTLLKAENLNAYIPKNLLERKGIIKYVDTTFDDKYLFENLMSPYRITEVNRFKRKIITEDGNAKLIPKQTVLLTFEGNVLPKNVYLNYVSCVVEPYIQKVIQCYNCLRYGHVAKQCNNTTSLCLNCGKSKDNEHKCRDPQDRFCIYCKTTEHKSISKSCPKHEEQAKIKKLMAENNLTFIESKQNLKTNYSNVLKNNLCNTVDTSFSINYPTINTNNAEKRAQNQSERHRRQTQISSQTIHPPPTPEINTNKKRKAQSPISNVLQPPMFPFRFGPKNPLPPVNREDYDLNSDHLQSNDFINNFFTFFQYVLNDIETFDQLKKINTEYVREKMNIFCKNIADENEELY